MSDVEKSLPETASADAPEELETDEARTNERKISLVDPSCWRLTPDLVVPCVDPPEPAGATFIV